MGSIKEAKFFAFEPIPNDGLSERGWEIFGSVESSERV